MTILVLGPVRAGKSRRAAVLAQGTGKPVILAATAAVDPSDREMCERIARHRQDRPREWTVIETSGPNGPSLTKLLREASPGTCILIDALGTWMAAQLFEWRDWAEADLAVTLQVLEEQSDELARALRETQATTIVVAEETGWGIVPASPLGRLFRDALGRLVQRVAADAERVELVVAGFVLDLRALGKPLEEL